MAKDIAYHSASLPTRRENGEKKGTRWKSVVGFGGGGTVNYSAQALNFVLKNLILLLMITYMLLL